MKSILKITAMFLAVLFAASLNVHSKPISYKLSCSNLQGISSGNFVLRLDTPQQNCGVFRSQDKAQNNPASSQIIIGIEYAAPGMAETFAALGVGGVKFYPDQTSWERMQTSKNARFNFRPIDRYVREYQDAGFKELVITLTTKGSWAVKNHLANFSPKIENLGAYEKWVRSVVERYDMDGMDDMPGLKRPVRYFEIGSEFSTFEPEPVEDYITMLERAYHAAHSASDNVIVLNAAFLATTAFKDHPTAEQYTASFDAVDKRIMSHSIADIRKILDRPDIFDAVDFHALGDPYEIEDTVRWLNYEMSKRGYKKSIVIGDTAPTPLISWGPATIYKGTYSQLGIIIPPATEEDRPRLAEYFNKLVDGDEKTVRWTESFTAADMVKKVVISAEQGVMLINMAFMEDLTPLKAKFFRAGAGTSPWGGMALSTMNPFTQKRTIKELRPSFYALKQLAAHLNGYTFIERVSAPNECIRLYRVIKNGKLFWISWFEPGKVILPEDIMPQAKLLFKAGGSKVVIESLIIRFGQTYPEHSAVLVKNGVAEITLTPTPVFIFSD